MMGEYINESNGCTYIVQKECEIYRPESDTWVSGVYYRELLDDGHLHGHYTMDKKTFFTNFKRIEE